MMTTMIMIIDYDYVDFYDKFDNSYDSAQPRFSIILVAFDLEEFGSQGALVFLHDFLLPKVYNDSTVISNESYCE